jgi:hypothetical protein
VSVERLLRLLALLNLVILGLVLLQNVWAGLR